MLDKAPYTQVPAQPAVSQAGQPSLASVSPCLKWEWVDCFGLSEALLCIPCAGLWRRAGQHPLTFPCFSRVPPRGHQLLCRAQPPCPVLQDGC